MNGIRQWLTQLNKAAAKFWQQRNRREQFMLTVASGVLLLTLIFLLLIDPAMTGRKRLQSNLSILRQQTVELQQLLRQAEVLSNSVERPTVTLSQSDIEMALLRNSLSVKNIALSGDSAKLEFVAVSFSTLLKFLQDIQKTEDWQVSEANLHATPTTGLVDTTITLRQKKNQ